MAIRIYNVLTRQKEALETLQPHLVSMYVCGPTVYSDAHVGHAMSSIVFDIIRRYLQYRGYEVRHVMNYTDVDDKIIIRANEIGMDPIKLAEGYIHAFAEHLRDLNVLPANYYPRATEAMQDIIDFIAELMEKGYAYATEDGSVYFRVSKDDDYGKLSRRKLDDMQAGVRIDINEQKEHPLDFALWKSAKPHEPYWETAWGQGRPGWHIECSAMVRQIFGDQIDIHGGGNDLLFPHHENEIAQSESLTGKPLARYWIHNGMLQLGGEKMSKSLGNLVRIHEFLAEHEADVFRLIVLNSSYRAPLTFNDTVIEQAQNGLERLKGALRATANDGEGNPAAQEALAQQVAATQAGFIDTMDDDFNSAGALGHLYSLVRAIHQARDAGADAASLNHAQNTLRELASILGLQLSENDSQSAQAAPFIELLLDLRQQMRQAKQWAFSDQIRDRLTELGVVIEDSATGSTWRWKN